MKAHHFLVLILFTVSLYLPTGLSALFSNSFLIGAYSNIRSYSTSANCSDSIATKAREAGFNALICKSAYEIQDDAPTDMFSILNDDSLDVIFDDWIFYPNPDPSLEKYGFSALSSGIDMKLEAEYASAADVNNNDRNSDTYFYMSSSASRVGSFIPDPVFSNNSYWLIPNDTSGYAYKDITYRWPNGSHYDRIGKEFRFLGNTTNDIQIIENNCLNVRFVFNATGLELYDNADTLAVFSFVKYNGMTTESTTYDSLYFYQSGSAYKKFVLTKGGYLTLPVFDMQTGCKEIVFEFPLKGISGTPAYTLDSQGVLTPDGWHMQMSNLNPWMYWNGNGRLRLDYIEYFDEVFTDYTDVAIRRSKLRSYDSVDNLTHYYGIDEPKAPHFTSFKILKEFLQSTFPANERYIVSAINLDHSNLFKPDASRYHLPIAYKDHVTPRKLMIDVYPFTGDVITWNNPGLSNFVQNHLNRVCDEYSYFRTTVGREANLIFIPQIFGEFKWGEGWTYLLPPAKTARCLQLLPLCYQPDGVLSYKFDSIKPLSGVNGEKYHYALAWHFSNDDSMDLTPQYYEIQEANRKLLRYAPIVRSLTWIGSETIKTTESAYQNIPFVSCLRVIPEPSNTYYQGFIQAGFYTNSIDSTLVMCVNRRTDNVINTTDGGVLNGISPDFYNDPSISEPHESQILSIIPSQSAFVTFGTHVALFDPYDYSICHPDSGEVRVEIGPGDGRLLQVCSSLPTAVTCNSVVKNVAFLSGTITIDSGFSVDILASTRTTILPSTIIRVNSGATLNISGEIAIGDNVSFVVEEGGQISFENANCTWGQGSFVEVNGGTLSIDSSSLDKSLSATKWKGLRVANSNLVTISDATLSNAEYHQVFDSNLMISNSVINVPIGSWGLLLKNSATGYQTEITNTNPGCGFYGTSSLSSKGIYLYTMKNPVYINNVDFQNLHNGIFKSTIPYATDSISGCNFVNCYTGIRLCNNGNGTEIQQCSFANTQTGKQGTGIQLVASSPTIYTSNFTNLYRGILTEFALISGIGIESSVTESNFYNCEMGIESRSSNHRLKANYFNRNNSGIVNHAGSNLNLSYEANNVLMNHNDNIVFYDTKPYESTIQLFTGHNDFYHLTDSSTSISAVDFNFDTNYYNFPITPDFTIDASKNWFQDEQTTINDPLYSSYVFVDVFDPSPTMPAPPPENDRLFMALEYESQELYELACTTYQAIIDDELVEEQTYVTSAIDGLYRCTKMIPNPAWDLTDYFDAKAIQYAIEEPTLYAILNDYLAKVLVLNKDFQAAVDLIQLRIDNPICELDSLRAVLDLEIVLQLAAMEEDKRPLTTKYAQYQYPDIQVFDVMHSNNWDKYNRALRQNDPDTNSVVAPTPQIQSNYPNPFNPSTTIAFSIPETGRVRVSIYNIKGQKVKDLLNTELIRGNHRLVWDGRDTNNRNVASGIYFIKLESGGNYSIRKAMLMK